MRIAEYTIDVTQDDLLYGAQSSTDCCPVALACRRLFNTARICVTRNTVIVEKNLCSVEYFHDAENFILDFDGDNSIEIDPFKVNLYKEEE